MPPIPAPVSTSGISSGPRVALPLKADFGEELDAEGAAGLGMASGRDGASMEGRPPPFAFRSTGANAEGALDSEPVLFEGASPVVVKS